MCRSAITHIDGKAGILQHRGYRIEALCERSNFLELAYLLINGELPTAGQYESWLHEIGTRNFVHENVKGFIEGFRYDARPIAMVAASVGALSSFYTDADQVYDEEARALQVVRLLAKLPTLAAFSYRHLQGLPYAHPEDHLSYTGNLLSMMFRMSELRYTPDPVIERALDVLLMLHADHEQNASTTAVRAVGSTHVNPYAAVAAGVTALSGPMRGRSRPGRADDAEAHRIAQRRTRVSRARQVSARTAAGLRPLGLQDLRPEGARAPPAARAARPAPPARPVVRDRRRARTASAGRRVLHLPPAVPEPRSVLRPHIRRRSASRRRCSR